MITAEGFAIDVRGNLTGLAASEVKRLEGL